MSHDVAQFSSAGDIALLFLSAMDGTTQPTPLPDSLPRQLDNAWQVLNQRPERAAVVLLPDSVVRIVLKKNPKSLWTLAIVCSAVGAVILLATKAFDRYQSRATDLPVTVDLMKLYIVAWMCVGVGLMMILINLAVGGVERDTIIEVSLGRLKIDRWVAGDHVVREYVPDEIRHIWTDTTIGVDSRIDRFSIALFAPPDVQNAAAEIAGTIFWGDRAIVERNVKTRIAVHGRARLLVRAQTEA
jgi:hypothetical protein